MTSRKKLIEHSLPLDAINAASSREKSVRHGHPSTLHLWWARRPLAACRAVLFAQLVDDPEGWPEVFRDEDAQDRERRRLHRVIEDMVEWPKSDRRDHDRFDRAIKAARFEIVRSLAREQNLEMPDKSDVKGVLAFLEAHAPPVYDPFCGGGSIPLEAQRLGLRAFGSDLNPVAVLITKALIEFPPRFSGLAPVHPDPGRDTGLQGHQWKGAQGLAEDVRWYGAWMREQAKQRIGHLYPKAELNGGDEATVIAWLWARTVASPDPAVGGAHVPLASSFVLSAKRGKEAIVVPVIDGSAQDGWRFEVKGKALTKEDIATAKSGTKSGRGSNFVCVRSGSSIGAAYIKAEGKAGRMGARLMAVVADGKSGRVFLSPSSAHEVAAIVDRPEVPEIAQAVPEKLTGGTCFGYGLDRFDKLFTPRQLTALTIFSDLVEEVREKVVEDANKSHALVIRNDEKRLSDNGAGPSAYADTVATYLGMLVSQVTNQSSSICGWNAPNTQMRSVFARQAIPMVWDFAESNIFSTSTGSFHNMWERMVKGLASLQMNETSGFAFLNDARSSKTSDLRVLSTDPPYYDNIGYADLSDYFYVWLRKSLKSFHPDLFRRIQTPKDDELVATPHRHGGSDGADAFFLSGMEGALAEIRASSAELPVTIFYAFKQSEIDAEGILSPGWAAFLDAVIRNGLRVDGTWPVRTEKPGRVVSIGANALASSVVLVCRKREDDAPTTSRRDFQRELRVEMEEALRDQQATIPLPDRRQAAIGPGIGVFSKYRCVREADDSEMTVATALALVNREIDAILAEGTEALDAETRFALEWYARNGFSGGRSGDAISALQGFNLSEAVMNRSGLFRARSGSAKLLTREEMVDENPNWSPGDDDTPTAWEMAQHLARVHGAQDGGIEAAGRMLAQRPDAGPDVLLVAERLYDMDNNRGRAAEALVWNELQADWQQILAAADRAREEGYASPAQGEMHV